MGSIGCVASKECSNNYCRQARTTGPGITDGRNGPQRASGLKRELGLDLGVMALVLIRRIPRFLVYRPSLDRSVRFSFFLPDVCGTSILFKLPRAAASWTGHDPSLLRNNGDGLSATAMPTLLHGQGLQFKMKKVPWPAAVPPQTGQRFAWGYACTGSACTRAGFTVKQESSRRSISTIPPYSSSL